MKFCICSVIKNETEFLEGWINYHLGLGINHFYLFEEASSKSHKEIAKLYPSTVTLTKLKYDISDNPILLVNLYDDFLKNLGTDSCDHSWCLFINPKEYLSFNEHYSLGTLSINYSQKNAVAIPKKHYDTSELISRGVKPESQNRLNFDDDNYVTKGHNFRPLVNLCNPIMKFYTETRYYRTVSQTGTFITHNEKMNNSWVDENSKIAYISYYPYRSFQDFCENSGERSLDKFNRFIESNKCFSKVSDILKEFYLEEETNYKSLKKEISKYLN